MGTFELSTPTATLLGEIHDPKMNRKQVALTYRLAMMASTPTDWAAVNSEIVRRWSRSALEWIKRYAHRGTP